MINILGLEKKYTVQDREIVALQHIDLHVPVGEIFGILGKSGAGKSTLLRCVNRLETPTKGQIFVDGVEITTLSAPALRKQRHKIGMIFQHFNLLTSRNVFENIALPLEILHVPVIARRKKVNMLLDMVGLAAQAHHYPHQLSGGQKQRVAIARALATNPPILLSDEATSALDPESTEDILRLLKNINQSLGVTILLITHEVSVIQRICHRVGIIASGKWAEKSTTLSWLVNPQSLIGQQFVEKAFSLSEAALTKAVYTPNSSKEISSMCLQLTFIGEQCHVPFVTSLTQRFDLSVNIYQAHIFPVQNSRVGFTLCELSGKAETLKKALEYIQTTSVHVKVVRDVNN